MPRIARIAHDPRHIITRGIIIECWGVACATNSARPPRPRDALSACALGLVRGEGGAAHRVDLDQVGGRLIPQLHGGADETAPVSPCQQAVRSELWHDALHEVALDCCARLAASISRRRLLHECREELTGARPAKNHNGQHRGRDNEQPSSHAPGKPKIGNALYMRYFSPLASLNSPTLRARSVGREMPDRPTHFSACLGGAALVGVRSRLRVAGGLVSSPP